MWKVFSDMRKNFNFKEIPSIEQPLFYYDGKSVVSKFLLEKALDFYILLEPDPKAENGEEVFEQRCITYEAEIAMARAAIKKYGEQIEPKTLENMQTKFYEITNSSKYRQTNIHFSVAYTLLSSLWDGIGSWKF